MKKRVERNTVTTVIFAIVFAILIIYALFVIIMGSDDLAQKP